MLEACLDNGNTTTDQWTKHNNQDSGYGGEAIHNMTRWDWGQDLFEWFEYYLKGVGPKPDNHAQIQRNDGQWRIEEIWPPQDATWETIDQLHDQQGASVEELLLLGVFKASQLLVGDLSRICTLQAYQPFTLMLQHHSMAANICRTTRC